MKIFLLLLVSLVGLALGGCASRTLLTDEEYKAVAGPAPNSPDPTGYIPESPETRQRPPGF